MSRLIGLVGRRGVGKDTAGDYLVARHGFRKRAFARPIKEACALLFQIDPLAFEDRVLKETPMKYGLSPRQMAQVVGTDLFRNHVSPTFWLDYFEDWYKAHRDEAVVVTDVRFQNEVDLIKALGGEVWHIKRQSSLPRDAADSHASEAGVDSLVHVSHTIHNDGTPEELHSTLRRLLLEEEEVA
jgi:hypothetical protein